MPTYMYACHGCAHTFDTRQPITADPLKACPSCEEPLLYRRPSAGGTVIFKGSGFYCTDYPKPKPKPK